MDGEYLRVKAGGLNRIPSGFSTLDFRVPIYPNALPLRNLRNCTGYRTVLLKPLAPTGECLWVRSPVRL